MIDLASMVLAPTAVKDGKVYNAIPNDQDFTFSRGTEATRVNSAGLIEKARTNFLLQSNTFDTTWTTDNTSVTSGQLGYDGSNDAWRLTKTANQYAKLIQAISSSNLQTYSFYVKADTLDYAIIYIDASTDVAIWIDLTDGSITNTLRDDFVVSKKVEDISNGWYRCSITTNQSVTQVRIFPNDTETTYGTTSGSIYIQSAQLEQGLVATDYIETGASTAQAGILEDMPRLDYSGGATCPSLLLEPQRTNIVTNSEYVSSNDYVVGNWTGTITSNTTETLSPDGGYNATKYVKAGASDRVYFHNSQPDGAYTGSIYLKAASGSENTTIEISVRRFGGGGGSTSKLVTITSEWQRFDVTATNLTGGTTTAMYVADFSMGGTATEFYSYGMQIEAGSYPTSYIPTYGASVTRGADDAIVNYTNISNTEGSLFWQGKLQSTTGTDGHAISISDSPQGAGNNRVLIYINNATENYQVFIQSAGSSQYSTPANLNVQSTDINDKIAMAWSNNDLSIYVNGTQVYTSSSGSVPTGMQYIQINEWNGNNVHKNQTAKAIYFNTALSDDELAQLTTI